MIDRLIAFSPLFRPLPLSAGAAILVAGFAAGAPSFAAPTPMEAGAAQAVSRTTHDPQPPMTLTVEFVSLQKNRAGGVASLLLKVSADIGIEDAVVSVKAPADLVFADGSNVKTWKVDLTTALTRSIPVEVIVPQDGKYVVGAEVQGMALGKPIRRGAALKLLVGVKEPATRARGGAIEYKAAEAGEPTP